MKSASRIKLAATVASVVRASTRPGSPSFPERVQAVPRLVRCTVDRTYAGTTLKRLGLVAGAVAYVASPIDLLPEAVLPVIGAADDAVVISWAVKAFFEETDRFLAWEAGQGMRRAHDATRTPPPTSGWNPADPVGEAGPRRDRDTTGAAAPRGLAGAVPGSWAGSRPHDRSGASDGSGARPTGTGRATGAGRGERRRLPEGARQAATDYVLESVRKRLER
ncbi:hypothetical protein GCM10009868_11850 [Terrabacter aerolatus]|uniref:DUF1232 domain-containing protein n=1 Tax=Terrabacter aerolatus TaxID=422442 RepID=A0A512CXV7_9MICO|nr:YkvA family protein [Terrabacter aerolatus]GEO29041.1 hypothetical protein TAE01_08510 [Terrabacter aerolatus]